LDWLYTKSHIDQNLSNRLETYTLLVPLVSDGPGRAEQFRPVHRSAGNTTYRNHCYTQFYVFT